jgi:hypothetical protein
VEALGGLPKSPDAKKIIRRLEKKHGWEYVTDVGDGGHGVGTLFCGPDGSGCRITVFGTANNTARTILNLANKCSHGKAPGKS